MPNRIIYIVAFFASLNTFGQESFQIWKSKVYVHLDNRTELLKDFQSAGRFIEKESKHGKALLAIDDSLVAREMYFERQVYMDTLVSSGRRSKLSKPVMAKYLKRLAYAYYDNDQAEGTTDILNKILAKEYRLPTLSRIECLMILGNLELNFQLPDRAISKYRRALSEITAQVEKNKPLVRSSIYNNIGLAHSRLNNPDSTIYYHQKAFNIRKKENSTYAMGQSLNNIGAMYYEIQAFDSALVYFEKGYHFRSVSPEAKESSLAESWTNIGKTHFRLGNPTKAKELLEKSLEYCKRANNMAIMKRNYEILHELYASEGDLKAAYSALGNYYLVRDSLYGLEETKELLRSSYKQELREQALSDSLNRVANRKIFEEKSRREEVIKYGLGFALVGLLLILGLLLRNYRNKVRSNKQISQQKNSLEEKNDEIIGSITYAKRLQDAILPSEQSLNKHLPEQFVWYRPKDIVAGDFYWMHTSLEHTFFAVSDCTGHGVPGALVSIVCSNAMNRATKEFGLKETGAILDKTTELVLESFSESKENVNDGMDVSLIRLKDKTVQFSGAYNGLWIVSEDVKAITGQLQSNQFRVMEGEGKSLIEIKANRQPVGYYENRVPFNSIDLELNSGDRLFLFTDGFGDQFGGSDNKKYKTSKLKRFLLETSTQSILDQRLAIATEFEAWKGSNEQVDDVCIAGIEID